MRAGCFAEKRVIDLLNERFVPFFFNRGGPGKGHDEEARKFTVGKTKNQYAYLAAFTADGRYLGETHVYADKDAVFRWLRQLLDKYPEYGVAPAHEVAFKKASAAADASAEVLFSAAESSERIGDYDGAQTGYAKVLAHAASTPQLATWSHASILRVLRYRGDWVAHERHEALARSGLATLPKPRAALLLADLDVERGRRLCAQRRWQEARTALCAAARDHVASPRLAEAHFHAGVACWFLDARDWARFHWCFVVHNLTEDRVYMRAYIAAAAEAMPYPNPELDNYKAPVGNIGTSHIVRGVNDAMRDYRRLLPEWRAMGR